jgi:hypothetical protein
MAAYAVLIIFVIKEMVSDNMFSPVCAETESGIVRL